MPNQLKKKLRAIRRRLQWIDFCLKFLTLVKWGGFLLLAFLVVSRLAPVGLGFYNAALWTTAAGAAVLLVWCALRPVRLLQATVAADEKLGLKERLSSALTIGEPKTPPERAVVRDAVAHAERIRPSQCFRPDSGKDLRWAMAPLVALALVGWFMPQFDLLAEDDKAAEKAGAKTVAVETNKEAAKRLEDLAKKLEQDALKRKSPIAERMEKDLKALAKEINEHKLSPQKAMAKVSKMQDRLAARKAEIEKRLATPNNLQNKGLGKHTMDMNEALKKGNFEQAAKKLEELKKKLQNNALSESEKQSLQKELKAMADQLGKESPLSKALANAAMKMGAGQFNSSLADLEMAMQSMMDMQSMLQELQMLDSLKYDMTARSLALSGESELCDECKAGGT